MANFNNFRTKGRKRGPKSSDPLTSKYEPAGVQCEHEDSAGQRCRARSFALIACERGGAVNHHWLCSLHQRILRKHGFSLSLVCKWTAGGTVAE